MDSFSWTDNLKIAFKSCSPCLWPHDEHHSQDELQDLLTNDTERMSLHSNPGQRKKKKKRKPSDTNRQRRSITLFGYSLFGRSPPIHLPDDDDNQDALYSTTTHSTSSTFDSDAAPIDSDTIAALSSPKTTPTPTAIGAPVQSSADVSAQRLKEKEERRTKRREQRELRRMAEAIAEQGMTGEDGFEGFQGSGDVHSTYLGPVLPKQPSPSRNDHDDDDDDDDVTADLDGSHYARNTPSGSNGGSDSRSRTSTSQSSKQHKKPKSKNTKSSSSSNTSEAQSPSPRQIVSPSTIEQGQGFFDLEEENVPVQKPDPGYMPITGFGGTHAKSRMASNLGSMLAHRGGDPSGD